MKIAAFGGVVTKDNGSLDKHAARARQRDHDDLQHEIAGRDVGRMQRFLSGERDGNPRGRERRERERQAQLSALEALLAADPAYRALYEDTMDQLRDAEAATETALAKALEARCRAQDALQDVLGRAATLPDGARVFRDADDTDNNVRREDGTLVSGDDLENIRWPEGAPDYETYLEHKAALDRAQETIEEIRTYQIDVLGNARDRMTDPDIPPSKDELQQIQHDIEDGMPEAVRNERHTEDSIEAAPTRTADITLPSLGG